ncbi:hypothetical protein HZB04_02520 [Candidatus Wolfebacteria bacterium]|nr:hypothetical protein [Candidatus Wolfebacteria bacterium]
MSEFFKPEKYSPEFQAAVEARKERPVIDVEVVKIKKEEGGEEEISVIDIAGMKVESLASREDILEVLKEIHPTAESLELLQSMAETFQQGRGLIVEGETARGKTYLMNKFTEMMFGRGVKPVDFYCNGQTDTMSLMAKWVPKTEDTEDSARWEEYAESKDGRKAMQEIIDSVKNGITNPKEIQNQFTSLAQKAGVNKSVSQWQFQYGALSRAMTLAKDPTKPISEKNPVRGTFMHIQEVGLAETHVIDALLQLGGEKGKLAGEIQLWEDGGRRVESGENFWIYYSTNPPENYPNRQGIDQALARRNTFLKLGEESPSSRQLKQYQDNKIPYGRLPVDLGKEIREKQKDIIFPIEKSGAFYDEEKYIDVRILISETVSDFHEKLKVAMKEKGIEQRTKQKFEITDDEWNMVYDFMRKFESPDMEATLDRAMFLHYISRFTDEGKENAWKLWEQVKSNKDFKERLGAALPKEKSIENVKKITELLKFKDSIEQDLENMKKDVEDFCKFEKE